MGAARAAERSPHPAGSSRCRGPRRCPAWRGVRGRRPRAGAKLRGGSWPGGEAPAGSGSAGRAAAAPGTCVMWAGGAAGRGRRPGGRGNDIRERWGDPVPLAHPPPPRRRGREEKRNCHRGISSAPSASVHLTYFSLL